MDQNWLVVVSSHALCPEAIAPTDRRVNVLIAQRTTLGPVRIPISDDPRSCPSSDVTNYCASVTFAMTLKPRDTWPVLIDVKDETSLANSRT